MSVLIVIPARKGSSFSRKNLRPLDGKPLIKYALESSRIKQIHATIVTTDDSYIIEAASDYTEVQIDSRPPDLADDTATLDQVMYYMANKYPEYDDYLLLPPTSPLRTSTHVEEALRLYQNNPCDSVISVTEELHAIWKKDADGLLRPLAEVTRNRQTTTPYYISNGAIFISSRQAIMTSKRKVSGRLLGYPMDYPSSVDIHSEEDIKLGEFLKRQMGR